MKKKFYRGSRTSVVIIIFSLIFFQELKADLIKPNEKFNPYDVVKIQLEALKNNNENDQGIEQTWLFAHPDNRKVTGPYARFRVMIYGQQYKYLINHSSHKIMLVSNSPNTYIYRIEIMTENKKLFIYEWHVQKGSDSNCNNCWFTSAVSQPFDQGNTI